MLPLSSKRYRLQYYYVLGIMHITPPCWTLYTYEHIYTYTCISAQARQHMLVCESSRAHVFV